jgi:hypothetical protein
MYFVLKVYTPIKYNIVYILVFLIIQIKRFKGSKNKFETGLRVVLHTSGVRTCSSALCGYVAVATITWSRCV